MSTLIRRTFGLWLAIWLIVPPVLCMWFIGVPLKFIVSLIDRYDDFTGHALAQLDSYIRHGREPIYNGVSDDDQSSTEVD